VGPCRHVLEIFPDRAGARGAGPVREPGPRASRSGKLQLSVEDGHRTAPDANAGDPLTLHAQLDVDEALAAHPGSLLADDLHLTGFLHEAVAHEIGAERPARRPR